MKIFKFQDDKVTGTRFIVVRKISAFGLTITRVDNETNVPLDAVVWVDVEANNFNRLCSYSEALTLLDEIVSAVMETK